MTLRLAAERDLATLKQIITDWRRLEWHGRGANRLAQQMAIYDMSELWRTELSGWGTETDLATAAGGGTAGA